MREKLKPFNAEIAIALSTTCILGGLYFQGVVFRFLGEHHQTPLNKLLISVSPQFIFFLFIPVITLLILGRNPKDFGFRIGDYKKGLLYAGACLLLMAPLLYIASRMPSFQAYYRSLDEPNLGFIAVKYGIYMLSWEFILRGYLYFSLEERVGNLAVWLQSVPFAIAHMGKPPAEALTCFFGGLVLGYISLKSRSFLYAFLVHWGIYMILSLFVYSRG